MYSFNLDYIFNIFYNILLAIRYVILFWILRIDKVKYLKDHEFDTWDGLRDRGWIVDPSTKLSGGDIGFGQSMGSNFDPNTNTVYLGGQSGVENLSWWDIIKTKIFGFGSTDIGSVSTSGSGNYSFSPEDVNFAIDKTNSNPWFSHLKFSIQNPLLSFFADLLTILAFVVLLILIYSMLKWLALVISPISEAKEKKRIEKAIKEKEKRDQKLEALRVSESPLEQEAEKREKKIEKSLPAGIAGLPIHEEDLTLEELEYIKEKRDILIDYKAKNVLPPLPIKNKIFDIQNTEKFQEATVFDKEEKVELAIKDDKKEWYMDRWNIVIGYMQGKEEAIWRIGLLEADNLLDEILIERGYPGITMAERLKSANFRTIDLAWAAHKVRNRIAHDGSKFILTDRIAKNTLELYRAVFKELKIFE